MTITKGSVNPKPCLQCKQGSFFYCIGNFLRNFRSNKVKLPLTVRIGEAKRYKRRIHFSYFSIEFVFSSTVLVSCFFVFTTLSVRQAIPGNSFPSSNSSDAPPPVEI